MIAHLKTALSQKVKVTKGSVPKLCKIPCLPFCSLNKDKDHLKNKKTGLVDGLNHITSICLLCSGPKESLLKINKSKQVDSSSNVLLAEEKPVSGGSQV